MDHSPLLAQRGPSFFSLPRITSSSHPTSHGDPCFFEGQCNGYSNPSKAAHLSSIFSILGIFLCEQPTPDKAFCLPKTMVWTQPNELASLNFKLFGDWPFAFSTPPRVNPSCLFLFNIQGFCFLIKLTIRLSFCPMPYQGQFNSGPCQFIFLKLKSAHSYFERSLTKVLRK